MKTIITIISFLTVLAYSSKAQQFNWANIEEESRNNVHLNVGYDYAATIELGYSRLLNTSLPFLLSTDFSMPMGENFLDDFKYRLGGEIRLIKTGNFIASANAMATIKRYNSEMVRIAGFGTELSLTAGYYKPGWYVAGEFGFDKTIVSNLKHKEIMKNNYPEINDGWYMPSGGNFFYGLQAGKSLKGQVALSVRLGVTDAEKDHENATIAKYFQFGISKKF